MDRPSVPARGEPPRPPRRRRWWGLAALPLAAVALSGCSVPEFGVKPGATTTARSTAHLWEWFTVGALIVGAIVVVLIAWAIVRYRRRGDDIPVQSQYHIPLEMTYTIIPILIVFVLFAATVVVENKVVADPKTSTTINVNAFQWGWKFTYPGTNAVVVGQTTQNPEMLMPENTNVHINLTSTDVIHGFYVRKFNFSRYALPGITNQFTFNAVQTGVFYGQCTQLCGLYHSLMYFRVLVVTPSQFKAWENSFTNGPAAVAAELSTLQQEYTGVPTKSTKSQGVQ